ncbi:AAA family ATPase [Rhizobium sp. NZLR1b]|uniref:AAA family ATPase n=1 Tax=unclassified Rhizobium TaxID=2613769 RepID=UPI001C82BEDB|nr:MULTISPECIES: AAA family ATPase [unclassified Rhizobium]MBX5174651.1 AAA family ATPase [Rhizobium sp. NZLR1b]MBX5181041.1 AAA family ATPase [Rhizobium sp. NZLR5]
MTQKPASRIVHINGWPGTGKLTVGRLLAERLGARLIDNHTLLNPAEALFSRSDPLHASLRGQIRQAFFDHAVRADPAESFVFTDALSDDADDSAVFSWYRDLAAARGVNLVAILIDCAPEENARRLASPGRSEALKLTDTATLQRLRANYKLLRGLAERTVEIDTTGLSPEHTMARILEDIGV